MTLRRSRILAQNCQTGGLRVTLLEPPSRFAGSLDQVAVGEAGSGADEGGEVGAFAARHRVDNSSLPSVLVTAASLDRA